MSIVSSDLMHPPLKLATGEGEPDIALALHNYLKLLVDANVTDAGLWPEGSKHGAELLREIRAIEQAVVFQHGRFHCDLMAPGVEDHYEELTARLDTMLLAPDWREHSIPLEDLMAELALKKS